MSEDFGKIILAKMIENKLSEKYEGRAITQALRVEMRNDVIQICKNICINTGMPELTDELCRFFIDRFRVNGKTLDEI